MTGALTATGAIIAFAFAIYVFTGLKSRVTPLLSMVILVDIAVVFALSDKLLSGVWLAYILAAVCFLLALYRCRQNLPDRIRKFFSPGVILFCAGSMLILYILRWVQPVFHDWDEFSFWGTARQLVNSHDALYTYYNSSLIGRSTPPATAVTAYFFGFFAGTFTEWLCYYAYDVLFLACFAALTATCHKKQSHIQVLLFTAALTVPFIFRVTGIGSRLSTAYISAYGDTPLGLVFAGGVAVYLSCEKNTAWDILPVLPVIIYLTYIKDMGFALSCIVAFIVFFDLAVYKKDFSFFSLKGLSGKTAAGGLMAFTALATFLSWSMHMAKVMQRDPFALGGETNMGMVQMLLTGVKELISPDKSRKFTTIMTDMAGAFFSTKVSMFGSGLRVVAVITAIFAVAFVFAGKKGRLRTAFIYLTSLTGFVGYYIFHIFLYVYIFKDNAYSLPSYDRYMCIYYMGWFCMALAALALSAKEGLKIPSQLAVCAVALTCVFVTGFYLQPGNMFIGANANSFSKRRLIQRKARLLTDAIDKDDVIYIISEGNAGQHWFIYSYELADNILVMEDYIIGVDSAPEEDRDIILRARDYMKQRGVTHLLVDNVNQVICRRYGQFFDVDIGEIAYHRAAYFKVDYTDDGFRFTFIKGGQL